MSLPPCLADTVRDNAVRFGSVLAYRAEGQTLTHAQLHTRATALAAALARMGLRRQDRIAVFGQNSIAFGEVLAAGQLSGLVVATVNFRLAPPEIGRILADAAPRVLFVDSEYLSVVDAIRPAVDIEHVVCFEGSDRSEVIDYQELMDSAAGADLPFTARPDDIACLVYTSGTTGNPKGCIIGQRELHASAHILNGELRTGSTDRVLLTMPMFHIGAMAIGLALHARGGTAVLHRKFEPRAVLDAIAADNVTTLHLAPTMLQGVLDAAIGDADALLPVKTVVYSAAPITTTTLAAAMRAMPQAGFLNLYGQTEVITAGLPRELHFGAENSVQRRLRSVGHPFPQTRVRIIDEAGNDCPTGQPGEVIVASPTAFRGYWNNSQATAQTLRDGWCHTGDVGFLDEEGLLHLVDRKKDIIISGGENIYSLEVEDTLSSHPTVARCAVIGVPDQQWGEAVWAIVEPADNAVVDSAQLRTFVGDQLARYKAPKTIVVVDALPILPTGKIDKKTLRAHYTAADGAV
ncbi:AMP-dependent synthetase [Nocardia nova]|uniref:AMP-dependent synthetase n=1 Tax=Nocardia nova TaxID=37330 RepID=A0A2S6AWC1_9NOCA|nr:AMP-binding protein [Nocardia nova]PPJ33759.1 AMP-dependent synthetase [Nocardia nova]PPJ39552.1 AMP-dependent synthetase [Nocardia nova]